MPAALDVSRLVADAGGDVDLAVVEGVELGAEEVRHDRWMGAEELLVHDLDVEGSRDAVARRQELVELVAVGLQRERLVRLVRLQPVEAAMDQERRVVGGVVHLFDLGDVDVGGLQHLGEHDRDRRVVAEHLALELGEAS